MKLVAELPGYKDSLTKEDYIWVSDIKAEFAADKRCGSAPLQVEFTDSSTSAFPISGWHWDFGDGETSDQQNPTHEFVDVEVFDVTLIVSDGIAVDTLTKEDYITTQETVSAEFVGFPTRGASPLAVVFEPVLEGIANLYLWDFGDGDTSSLPNPIHIYTAQGEYDVKLVVRLDLNECHQVDSLIEEQYVMVNDLEAQFSASPQVTSAGGLAHNNLSAYNSGVRPFCVRRVLLSGFSNSNAICGNDQNLTSVPERIRSRLNRVRPESPVTILSIPRFFSWGLSVT